MIQNKENTRKDALDWFAGLDRHIKRGFVDSYISRTVNISDATNDQIEYMYLCEHPEKQPLQEHPVLPTENNTGDKSREGKYCFAAIETMLDILNSGDVTVKKGSMAHNDLIQVKETTKSLVSALKDVLSAYNNTGADFTNDKGEKLTQMEISKETIERITQLLSRI